MPRQHLAQVSSWLPVSQWSYSRTQTWKEREDNILNWSVTWRLSQVIRDHFEVGFTRLNSKYRRHFTLNESKSSTSSALFWRVFCSCLLYLREPIPCLEQVWRGWGRIRSGKQHIPKAVVLADLLEPHWPLSLGGRSDCVQGISFSCPFLGVLSCDSWLWTQRPFSPGGSAFLFVFLSSVHCVFTVETGACLPPPLSGPCMPSVCFTLWPFKFTFQTFTAVTAFITKEHNLSENCVHFRRICQM